MNGLKPRPCSISISSGRERSDVAASSVFAANRYSSISAKIGSTSRMLTQPQLVRGTTNARTVLPAAGRQRWRGSLVARKRLPQLLLSVSLEPFSYFLFELEPGQLLLPSARFYDNRIFMKKSINDNQKRRGRPATGTAPMVGVRMTPEFQSR